MMSLKFGINGFVFVFGTDIATASLIKLAHADNMFFPSRKAAVKAAREHNLTVARNGLVTASEKNDA